MEIVVATRNRKKLLELERLLKGYDIKVLGLDSFNGLPEVKENGKTFRANARRKALAISGRVDKLVMADDSGLEIPALNNKPGVNSARYAGHSQDDKRNIAKLLKKMEALKGSERRARFRCVICLSRGRRVIRLVEGRVKGRIDLQPRGNCGFGYDPVFVPQGFKKTFAQLGPKVKDRISHRAKALKEAKGAIQRYFRRYP